MRPKHCLKLSAQPFTKVNGGKRLYRLTDLNLSKKELSLIKSYKFLSSPLGCKHFNITKVLVKYKRPKIKALFIK